MPYCRMLPFIESHQWEKNTAHYDFFNQDWIEWCDYVTRSYCAELKGDPNLIGYFFSDCPQGMAAKYGAKIVVFGHTHVPEDAIRTGTSGNGDSTFVYANAGFNCVSIPNIACPDQKRATFVEIEEGDSAYTVTIMEVVKSGDSYIVQVDPRIPPMIVDLR